MNRQTLPEPDADSLELSRELLERIVVAIDQRGGWLEFESFMQMALYEPGLGYYRNESRKFGVGGDFTTAPELGSWLAEALAAFLAPELETYPGSGLLEPGAGSGALAGDLLAALAQRGHAAVPYSILETSAVLRERQQQRIQSLSAESSAAESPVAESPAAPVQWLDGLPESPQPAFVIANEVADALPVVRFEKRGGRTLPLGVVRAGNGLALAAGPEDETLSTDVAALESELGATFADGYRSEICRLLGPWLEGMLGSVAAGGMLLIDYGLPRRDYYRPERSDGTLICHYRQRAHSDPLLWPGLQDLTAWVDFSSVAAAARRAGFTVSGFTTQGQFLLNSIAADPLLAAREPTAEAASALKTLVLPGEMGERFKLIWLTRDPNARPLPGRDYRSWL